MDSSFSGDFIEAYSAATMPTNLAPSLFDLDGMPFDFLQETPLFMAEEQQGPRETNMSSHRGTMINSEAQQQLPTTQVQALTPFADNSTTQATADNYGFVNYGMASLSEHARNVAALMGRAQTSNMRQSVSGAEVFQDQMVVITCDCTISNALKGTLIF
ncbi:hypothetical protein M409DRAFT_51019 [Zasmidium cellare ATCC 36951]|uniref:Uncharacterized protein n=1 Tax=Zasmidium cellare ATCC 36951 TaxID=1080233 RepID=A0A6A6CU18_ZASCE|nr:uncharacterized protein M409DRAFT_51019 [Zasmidium cellare ATCC 36951]KAF2170757.1 hypothetical protein M409DRAFT_51019 [Zasmidium cellare ATCC 36951]